MMRKIGEIAKMLGVKTHTVRFWQSNFPHIKSVNTKSNTRYYDEFACAELTKIRDLMYVHGMRISGIQKLAKGGKISAGKILNPKQLDLQHELFHGRSEVKDGNLQCKLTGVDLDQIAQLTRDALAIIDNIILRHENGDK